LIGSSQIFLDTDCNETLFAWMAIHNAWYRQIRNIITDGTRM